jgi:DNA-binding NarL/FixJ family response regulator
MIKVFIVDTSPEERSALRWMLKDLNMQVVGEASDCSTLFNEVPKTNPDLVLIDYALVRSDINFSVGKIRAICSPTIAIVVMSSLNFREMATISTGADIFISKNDLPEDIARQIQDAADHVITSRLYKE